MRLILWSTTAFNNSTRTLLAPGAFPGSIFRTTHITSSLQIDVSGFILSLLSSVLFITEEAYRLAESLFHQCLIISSSYLIKNSIKSKIDFDKKSDHCEYIFCIVTIYGSQAQGISPLYIHSFSSHLVFSSLYSPHDSLSFFHWFIDFLQPPLVRCNSDLYENCHAKEYILLILQFFWIVLPFHLWQCLSAMMDISHTVFVISTCGVNLPNIWSFNFMFEANWWSNLRVCSQESLSYWMLNLQALPSSKAWNQLHKERNKVDLNIYTTVLNMFLTVGCSLLIFYTMQELLSAQQNQMVKWISETRFFHFQSCVKYNLLPQEKWSIRVVVRDH